MKIVIAGGTGFIGKALLKTLNQGGHDLTLLSRNIHQEQEIKNFNIQVFQWNPPNIGNWTRMINECDAVINLSGEPIASKRWTKDQKSKILRSRIESTQTLAQAINNAPNKPKVLINASAVGYYGNVENGEVTESTSQGQGFLAETCSQWEKAASEANTRVVHLRIGIVLEKGGGALKKMLLPFKLFAGGPLGNGQQWFPWIHRDDIIHSILFALENQKLSGPVNLTPPNPVTMNHFCKRLGKALSRPSWAPVPAFVLKTALGEMSELLLTGQKAIPKKLQDAGYKFIYPEIDSSLKAILNN